MDKLVDGIEEILTRHTNKIFWYKKEIATEIANRLTIDVEKIENLIGDIVVADLIATEGLIKIKDM